MDQWSLKHLIDQWTVNAQHARWMEFLSEIDFEIKHVKGKEKIGVDVFNWTHLETISICKFDLKERILESSSKDEAYPQIKETIQ